VDRASQNWCGTIDYALNETLKEDHMDHERYLVLSSEGPEMECKTITIAEGVAQMEALHHPGVEFRVYKLMKVVWNEPVPEEPSEPLAD